MADSWMWGTVTQASPLRVRLDGDTVALTVTPDPLTVGLVTGDRVYCQIRGRRLVVWGRSPAGNVTIRRGKSTVTTASDGRASITHNLGVVPAAVIVSLYGNSDGGTTAPSQIVVATGATTTTFPVRVLTSTGGAYASLSVTIAWEAWA